MKAVRVGLISLLAAVTFMHPWRPFFGSTATAAATTPELEARPAIDQPPRAADVVAARFIHRAELDNGAFEVSPARAGQHPPISIAQATVLLHSDPSAAGSQSGQLLAFGLVSIRSGLGVKIERVQAWVGLTWGGVTNCPAMTVPSGPTTTVARPPTPGYKAVIILNAHRVFDYRSRGSQCGFPSTGPSAGAATETVSVPWTLSSFQGGTVSYRYQVPSCEKQAPASESIGGDARTATATLIVELSLPFDRPSCTLIWLPGSLSLGPPAGPGAPEPTYTTIAHGSTGPIGSF